jgi:hypothetical protein
MKRIYILKVLAIIVLMGCDSTPNSNISSVKTIEIKPDYPYCSFSTHLPLSNVYVFDRQTNANEISKKILDQIGLPCNYKISAADVPNAAALIYSEDGENDERYILYNPEFMKNVSDSSKNDWVHASILAHEIGHHLIGHTLIGDNRKEMELEADMFSGFMLRKLGRSKDDATAAVRVISNNIESETHPKKSSRIAAILAGWEAADVIAQRNIDSTSSNKNEDFYIIVLHSFEDKVVAEKEKEELKNRGYKADILWIPDYPESLGSNELFSVYIGPFETELECGIAVDNYRKSHPADDFYGLLVSKNKPRMRIDGTNKISSH